MDVSFLDHYVKHAIGLERLSLSTGNKLVDLVKGIDLQAIDKIGTILNLYQDGKLTLFTLETLITDVFSLYAGEFPARFRTTIATDMAAFIGSELDFQRDSLNAFTRSDLPVRATIDTGQMSALVAGQPVQNQSLNAWVSQIFASKASKLESAIRVGIASGDSVGSIMKLLTGVFNLTNNNLRTLVRTSIQSAAATVRATIFEENKDIVKDIRWLSTLDNRVTVNICAPRDQKRYTIKGEPSGHNLTWRGGPGNAHWNCRSTSVPVIADIDLGGRRPAISAGKNYGKGDNLTRTGGVRKATKVNRDSGIYKVEQVNSGTTYEDWLIRQPADFQDDILGDIKGRLFRKGSLKLGDLSNRFGEPITLDELVAQNKIGIGDI